MTYDDEIQPPKPHQVITVHCAECDDNWTMPLSEYYPIYHRKCAKCEDPKPMTTPNKDPEFTRKIETMAAWAMGKTIEVQSVICIEWSVCPNPKWNWDACNYRIKPEPRSMWVVITKTGTIMEARKTRALAAEHAMPTDWIIEFREVMS